jgi:hypothetical protein
MKGSNITEKFTFENFKETYPSAIIMFLSNGKGLRTAPTDLEKVAEGTTVYALIPHDELPPAV